MSHFTQESLFVFKERLSVCLELTHKTVCRVLLHGRRQGDPQAMCAPEFAGGPSSSLTHWSSHGRSAELMSRNLLCHSTCAAHPNTTFILEMLPVPCSFCPDPITTLENKQEGSPHSHSPLADAIQGGHVICPRSHFYWWRFFQLITSGPHFPFP